MSETKRAQSLNETGPAASVAEIRYHEGPLLLPHGMAIPEAVDLLERRQKYLETKVDIKEAFDVFPWDGANAVAEVLTQMFGWAPATSTPSFFGPQPPKMITIATGYKQVKTVPWGAFSLPGVEGRLNTSVDQKGGRLVFALVAQVMRKDEATIRKLYHEVREYLKVNSIYRGKAIKMRFLDDDGDKLEMPEPEFLATDHISREMLIYSKQVMDAVETNLFAPIERVDDCMANGLPIKRGVLLGGTYGTGKTLAATVASKLAVDNGITYLYVPRADELSLAIEFAKQYQSPAAVIFCEDIDRVMAGERSVAMDDILNIIDGIDTKASHILTVLTTNDLKAINPAMLRPGRLDAVIEVTPPDAEAVERLLRFYGGSSIAVSTDLTMAGKAMEGQIPAVIHEVIKRAKLVQMRLLPKGTPVTDLSEDAIVEAAVTMRGQLDLLKSQIDGHVAPVPTIEQRVAEVVLAQIEPTIKKVKDVADRLGV